MKTKLTKPILEALGKYPLFWARFESDSRTVASGFGLYMDQGGMRCSRQGMARLGKARRGEVWQSRKGDARHGALGSGLAG
jgi:hypothetical protein